VSEITTRPITAEEARPLRANVLRPGRPHAESIYPGDGAAGALHLGAFRGRELVGVASVLREPPPGEEDAGAWRLRGMAVAPGMRRGGYGRALIEGCLAHVASQGGSRLWCNARSTAAGFYRTLGFEVSGEEFETSDGTPHFLMWLRLR
jgi:predicted GNAT family N-acyltransferase